MNMIFRNAKRILKNNFIFIQPLLLYMLLAMLVFGSLLMSNAGLQVKLLLFISLVLMFAAFLSGWVSINMVAVDDYNPYDDFETINQKTLKNLKSFFLFVGENFTQSLFGIITYFAFYLLVSFGVIYFTTKCVGEPTAIFELANVMKNTTLTASQFLELQDKANMNLPMAWIIVMTVCPLILNFLGVLYFVILFKTKKNVFVSMFETLKFFFMNFTKSIYLIFILFLIYFVVGLITMFLGSNSLTAILFVILFAIYFNYYLILVFCFYNEKTKNNSNSRAEFIG